MQTTINPIHDIGIARQIGNYSDAVEISHTGRILFLSGTPGLTPDGKLSQDFEEQAEQAWRNVLALLELAGMGPDHLVKIVQYLVRSEDIRKYSAVRTKMLGACRPASMLLVISALARPDFLIEIEAYASAPGRTVT
jgi:enamine deaminase RidA (YjgF/YER057c/UK114 family)